MRPTSLSVLVFCVWLIVPAMARAQTATPPQPPAAEAAAALTDAERCSVDSLAQRATIVALRAEVARLAARVAELEAPLVAQAVATERQQLEQRFRERLKPPTNSTFDWQTLTFTTPPATAPPK